MEFPQDPQTSNFVKLWEHIYSMRTDERMDRETDVTKVVVPFRSFAAVLKNEPAVFRRYSIK